MAIACHNSCGVAEGKAKEMAVIGVARINTKKIGVYHRLYANQTPTNLVWQPHVWSGKRWQETKQPLISDGSKQDLT
jgi:hypothetical protein